jgi:hypothetical protein
VLQELYESAELLNEGLLILKRIERQAGPILSGAQANLAGAIGADRQSGRRVGRGAASAAVYISQSVS